MSYGAASWLTEVSPWASCARMPRRVASDRAPKVASRGVEYLTIWFSMPPHGALVKKDLALRAVLQAGQDMAELVSFRSQVGSRVVAYTRTAGDSLDHTHTGALELFHFVWIV